MADDKIKNVATAAINDGEPTQSNETVIAYEAKFKDPKITKKASVTKLASGEIATYTFDIKNQDSKTGVVEFIDNLDPRTIYVVGTFKVDGISQTPSNLAPITYTITNVAGLQTVVITFDVQAL